MPQQLPVIVVIAGGGQGKVVLDACFAAGLVAAGLLAEPGVAPWGGLALLGSPGDWKQFASGHAFVLANGQAERLALGEAMLEAGVALPQIIHPSAVVAASARVGAGSVLMAGVTLNPDARVGRFVIVNANCAIDHDCLLEDASQLGPGVTFPGGVRVGEGAFIGAGAVALPGRSIGAHAVVGAGAVVTKDVAAHTVVAGNPARVLERRGA